MKTAVIITISAMGGYFNLISKADIFVFLNDVQFAKHSWDNRNRILVNLIITG